MESAIMITGLTLGGMLAFPLLLEWFRRFQVGLVLCAAVVIGLYLLAPHSSQARLAISALSWFPSTVSDAVDATGDGLASLHSEYFNAFHG